MTDLPEGWTIAPLADLVDVNPRRFDVVPDDKDLISLVPMASVEAESGRIDASKGVLYGEVKNRSLTAFQEGDVLFAKVTPCMENGKVAVARGLIGGRGLGSTEFFALRPFGAIESEYLALFLLQRSVRREAERHMSGAVGLRRVPRAYIAGLPVPVPPLAEQRRIVAGLGEYLSLIAAGLRGSDQAILRSQLLVPAVCEAAARGELPQVFVDGCLSEAIVPAEVARSDWVEPPRRRPPISAKNIPSWSLPRGWTWASLDELSEFVIDGDHNPPKRVPHGIPHITAKNIKGFRVSFENCSFLTEEGYLQTSRRYSPGINDVLVTCVGTIGRTALVSTDQRFSVDRNIAAIRTLKDRLSPAYLNYVLNSHTWQNMMATASSSSAQPHLYLGDLRALPIPVPPISEQVAITQKVDALFARRMLANQSVARAALRVGNLRSSVSSGAFSGKLMPQHPNDEPASELLARIRAERAAVPPKQRAPRGPRTQKDKPAPPTRVIGRDYQQGELPL